MYNSYRGLQGFIEKAFHSTLFGLPPGAAAVHTHKTVLSRSSIDDSEELCVVCGESEQQQERENPPFQNIQLDQ